MPAARLPLNVNLVCLPNELPQSSSARSELIGIPGDVGASYQFARDSGRTLQRVPAVSRRWPSAHALTEIIS